MEKFSQISGDSCVDGGIAREVEEVAWKCPKETIISQWKRTYAEVVAPKDGPTETVEVRPFGQPNGPALSFQAVPQLEDFFRAVAKLRRFANDGHMFKSTYEELYEELCSEFGAHITTQMGTPKFYRCHHFKKIPWTEFFNHVMGDKCQSCIVRVVHPVEWSTETLRGFFEVKDFYLDHFPNMFRSVHGFMEVKKDKLVPISADLELLMKEFRRVPYGKLIVKKPKATVVEGCTIDPEIMRRFHRHHVELSAAGLKRYTDRQLVKHAQDFWKPYCPLNFMECQVCMDNNFHVYHSSWEVRAVRVPEMHECSCICDADWSTHVPDIVMDLVSCSKNINCSCLKKGFPRGAHTNNCLKGRSWSCNYNSNIDSAGYMNTAKTFVGDEEVRLWIEKLEDIVCDWIAKDVELHAEPDDEKLPLIYPTFGQWLQDRINESRSQDTELRAEGLLDNSMKIDLSAAIEQLGDMLKELIPAFKVAAFDIVGLLISIGLKMFNVIASGFDAKITVATLLDACLLLKPHLTTELFAKVKEQFQYLGGLLTKWCKKGDTEGITVDVGQEVRAESFLDTVKDFGEGLVTFFGETLCLFVDKISPGPHFWSTVYAGITKMGNVSRGLKFTWDLVGNIFSWTFEKLYQWWYGVPYSNGLDANTLKQLKEWVDDVRTINALFSINIIKTDEEYSSHVRKAYAEALELSETIRKLKDSAKLWNSFNVHFQTLKGIFNKVIALGPEKTGTRIPPFVIMLQGGTGVGKTMITKKIAADCLKALGVEVKDETELINHVYNRNHEQEFWDGYRFQEVCIYDDFGQQKDFASKPNPEFMELIRMNNTAPFNLHMASIDEKAQTKFLSSVVILSTNMTNFGIKSLVSAEAFRRRVKFAIHMARNPDKDTENLESAFDPNYSTFSQFEVCENPDFRNLETFKDYNEMIYELTRELVHYRQEEMAKIASMEKTMLNDEFIYTHESYLDDLEVRGAGDPERAVAAEEREGSEASFHSIEENPGLFRRFVGRFSSGQKRRSNIATNDRVTIEDYLDFQAERAERQRRREEEEEREIDEIDIAEAQGLMDKIWEKCAGTKPEHTLKGIGVGNSAEERDDGPVWRHYIANEWKERLTWHSFELKSTMNEFSKDSNGKLFLPGCMSSKEFEVWKGFLEQFGGKMAKKAIANADFQNLCIRGLSFESAVIGQWWATLKKEMLNYTFLTIDGRKLIAGLIMHARKRVAKGERCTDIFKDEDTATLVELYYSRVSIVKMAEDVETLLEKIVRVSDEFAEKHPIVSGFIFLLGSMVAGGVIGGLIGLIMGMLFPPPQAEAGQILTHEHEGLTLGKFAQHWHECEECGKPFQHGHPIRLKSVSMTYGPHLCKDCKKKSEKLSPYRLGELATSGDPASRQTPVRKVEVASSGDPRTVNRAQRVVELAAKGDVKAIESAKELLEEQKKQAEAEGSKLNPLNWFKSKPEPEGWFSNKDEPGKTNIPMKVIEATTGATALSWLSAQSGLEAEARFDDNGLQVQSKVLNNCYVMDIKKPSGQTYGVRCMFVKGRIALTVSHVLNFVEPGDVVELKRYGMTIPLRVPAEKCAFTQLRDNNGYADAVLIVFPNLIPLHSDLTKFFCEKQDHSHFTEFNGLVVMNGAGEFKRFCYGSVKQAARITYKDELAREYIAIQSYRYKLETARGDCGSPLFVVGSAYSRKLVGIHVAGGKGDGYALAIFKEMIEEGLEKIKFSGLEAQCSIEPPDYDRYLVTLPEEDPEIPEGQFLPIRKLAHAPGAATKTKLRPSLIQEFADWHSTTVPAVLGPYSGPNGELLDPMAIGLKKAGVPCTYIEPYYIEAAMFNLLQVYSWGAKKEHKQILTDVEMIQGREHDPFLPGVRRQTSPGYPWSLDTDGMPGKSKWLGTGMEYECHPELAAAIEERENLARQGIRMPVVWVDTLKDERRPIEKVLQGKTRVFSAGPMDYTILFRKYFLGFCASLETNRIFNEISVGTNVYSIDWQHTFEKVTKFGEDSVVAGDFSNFDGTLQISILSEMVNLINDWYDDGFENRLIRKVLWEDIIYATHLWKDNLYAWTHGQPSGCPMTAILNSIYNSASVRICYLMLAEVHAPHLASMQDFKMNVSMVSYGDDNLIGISPRIVSWFNQITLAEAYASIGMTYTDESKSGDLLPVRNIRDVAYLKRQFRFEPVVGRNVAPLALNTIHDMCLWIRGDDDQAIKTLDNISTALFEMALHGKEAYEAFLKRVSRAVAQSELSTRSLFAPMTWREHMISRFLKAASLPAADAESGHEPMDYEDSWTPKLKALVERQIVEGFSRLDLSYESDDDENSVGAQVEGGLFRLDDGTPPSKTKGSHPTCTRAETVLEAQGKLEGTMNNDSNKQVFGDQPEEVLENLASTQEITKNVIPNVEKKTGQNDQSTETMSNLVAKYLEKNVVLFDGEINLDKTVTLQEYINSATVAKILSSFGKFNGVWCVQFELITSTMNAVAGFCKIRRSTDTPAWVSNGQAAWIDNNRDAVVVLKRPINIQGDFVPTTGTLPTAHALSAEMNLIAIMSAETTPTIRCKITSWIENATVAFPNKAQGRFSFPVNSEEPSIEYFNQKGLRHVGEELMRSKTYLNANNFQETQPVGALIKSQPVFTQAGWPNGCPQRVALGLANDYTTGTLEFLFKAVKTPFHKGKVRISVERNGSTNAEKNSEYPSVVWDLAVQDTFRVSVPYSQLDGFMVGGSPWTPSLTLRVESPLTRPDTVSDSVAIATFCGISDFRVLDTKGSIPPVLNAQGLLEEHDAEAVDYTFTYQGNPATNRGATVWEMMKRFPCYHVRRPADTNFNALAIGFSMGYLSGWITLLKFVTYWCGSLQFEIAYGNFFQQWYNDQGVITNYLLGPYSGKVAVGYESLPASTAIEPTPSFVEPDSMGMDTYLDAISTGQKTIVDVSPVDFRIGSFVGDDMFFGPGGILYLYDGTMPAVSLMVRLGDNFQAAYLR